MSDDVDKLLRDYLVVIDQKDKHQFQLAERTAELEGILRTCRAKLLHQSEALAAREDERAGLLQELEERKTHICAMDEELTSHRTFNRSVRKLLVMDGPGGNFSLAEVLHVLCARLEDYGVVARAYQAQALHSQEMRRAWEQSLTVLESQHRTTMEEAFEASHLSATEMLASALHTISSAQYERDAARSSHAAAVERAAHDALCVKEAITAEVAALRSHVDQLVAESAALRRERDEVVCQLKSQAATCRVLEAQRDQVFRLMYKRNVTILLGKGGASLDDDGGGDVGGLADFRAHIMDAAQAVMNSCHQQLATLESELQGIRVVNEDLRHQITTAAKAQQIENKRYAQEKRASEEQLISRAECAFQQIAELRQQLSDSVGRERASQNRLRDAREHAAGLEAESQALRSAHESIVDTVHRQEHELRQKTREAARLKKLLADLHESSAQLRHVITSSDTAIAAETHKVESLSLELNTWQNAASENRKHVEELQTAVSERSALVKHLSEELHDTKARMSEAAAKRLLEIENGKKELVRLQDDIQQLRTEMSTIRLDRDAARVELGIVDAQKQAALSKQSELELQVETYRLEVTDARVRERSLQAEKEALVAQMSQRNVDVATAAKRTKEMHSHQRPIYRDEKHNGYGGGGGGALRRWKSPPQGEADDVRASSSGSGGSAHGPTPSRHGDPNNNEEDDSDDSYDTSSLSTATSCTAPRDAADQDVASAADLIHMIEHSMVLRAATQPSPTTTGKAHSIVTSGRGDRLRNRLAQAEAARDLSVQETARLREQYQMGLLIAQQHARST